MTRGLTLFRILGKERGSSVMQEILKHFWKPEPTGGDFRGVGDVNEQ